jgi:hypothetical protein
LLLPVSFPRVSSLSPSLHLLPASALPLPLPLPLPLAVLSVLTASGLGRDRLQSAGRESVYRFSYRRELGKVNLDVRRAEFVERADSDTADDHGVDGLSGQRRQRLAHAVRVNPVPVRYGPDIHGAGVNDQKNRRRPKMSVHVTL